MKVSVYLGSSPVCDQKYHDIAYETGKQLALHGHTLVYGGSIAGTMGDLSRGAQEHGGRVIGVFPRGFKGTREMQARGIDVKNYTCDQMIDVENFAERKQVMEDLGDCAVVLPGSFGTLDELFTYACNHAIDKHSKIIHVLNFEGYYDHMEAFFENMNKEHFLKDTMKGVVNFYPTLDDLIAAL